MPSAPAKGGLGTLRFRLTLWNTAVLAGLVLASLLAVYAGLHFTLMRMIDEFLDEELEAAAREVTQSAPDWETVHGLLDRRAAAHPRRRFFVQIYTEDRRPLWGSTRTPPGRVRVTLAEEAPGTAVLRVADSGGGIAPEDLPRVFERFYRGDKGRGRHGQARGTGLGLNICQAIVTAHRGTVAVASTPGCGTVVTVRLPGCTRPAPGQKKESFA